VRQRWINGDIHGQGARFLDLFLPLRRRDRPDFSLARKFRVYASARIAATIFAGVNLEQRELPTSSVVGPAAGAR